MKKVSLLTLLIVFLDRIFKILVKNILELNVKNKVINNFFYLTYCKNEGAAFSILSGKNFILIILTFVFLYIIYIFIKDELKSNKLSNIKIFSYSLLVGGIIGNLIDRVLYNYVIDYLDFKIFNYNFAIFNFADVCIVLSVIILIFFSKGSVSHGEKRN